MKSMSLTTNAAYIATVERDHTIHLPDAIPVGAKVAVLLLPIEEASSEHNSRHARFEQVLAAVRAAMAEGFSPPAISDTELNARIRRARQSANINQTKSGIIDAHYAGYQSACARFNAPASTCHLSHGPLMKSWSN